MGKPLIDAGYTALPNVVLVRAQALALDPLGVTIILHLASYWWHKDKPPFPSKKALADGIGVHVSTIRRRIAALEQGGLILLNPQHQIQLYLIEFLCWV